MAEPAATVEAGRARFTVLTSRMLRMEWAEDGRFEDRASLVFLNRRLPVPDYTTTTTADGRLVLETDHLVLRYRPDTGPFDADNLEVRVAVGDGREGPADGTTREVTWRPGMADDENLGGTIRTLDGVDEPVPLPPGLLSRSGWALVDDTPRPLLDDSEFRWVVPRSGGERLDWYLLGYGHDYTAALGDFTRVAGRIPMPPRFAFGSWWSRYWAYTDAELMELVADFRRHDVPLDVLVVDMDWHETFELRWRTGERDQAGQRLGWTGYTWNPTYFPDPESFLAWAEHEGLKTPLNLHPASGIQPHEVQYEAMARAVGIDPATERYVPFRIEDEDFARAYFRHVIHPLEAQGVDFWWLDWQQWHDTEIPGLTPTWWLNHVFFTDMRLQGESRPIILHRYGGLGNHRYQIGFSGDARSSWTMLDFEPYFTATASNVLFGYWSHDIGGHQPGEVSPELYTRWVQYGAVSPVLRTHTTKNPDAERRIWAYPPRHFEAMRRAFHLRYALIPYLYTAAREAYETGVSPVRPLYYRHPERDEAYAFDRQYYLGPDLLVRPVTAPADSVSGLSTHEIWLPSGEWIEWMTGARLEGPAVVERSFTLEEIPLYVRPGTVLPMAPHRLRTSEPVDPLVLTVFPGAHGTARLYRDHGDSLAYEEGAFAWTELALEETGDGLRLRVDGARGGYRGMPDARAYEIRIVGAWPPESVAVDGRAVPYAPGDDSSARGDATGPPPGAGDARWRYEGDGLVTVISVPRRDVRAGFTVDVELPAGRDDTLLDGVPGLLRRLGQAADLLEELWPVEWPPESLLDLAQTGRRISLDPSKAEAELRQLRRDLSHVLGEVEALAGVAGEVDGGQAVVRRALARVEGR